jgi:hypothetical protein
MHGGEESRLKTAGESIGDAGSTIAASGLFDCVRDVLNKETEFLTKRRANVDTTDQLCSEYEEAPPRATNEAKKNELLERKGELQLLEMTKMKETSEQDSKAMERLVSQLKTTETDNAAALKKLRAESKADLERLQQKVVSAKSDKVGSSTSNSPELLSALSVDVMCFDVTVNCCVGCKSLSLRVENQLAESEKTSEGNSIIMSAVYLCFQLAPSGRGARRARAVSRADACEAGGCNYHMRDR